MSRSTANLAIVFSEPVDTAPRLVRHPVLGQRRLAQRPCASGTGQCARTLDPDVDFAIGETCTVTLAADDVVIDLDGAADATRRKDYISAFGDYVAG